MSSVFVVEGYDGVIRIFHCKEDAERYSNSEVDEPCSVIEYEVY